MRGRALLAWNLRRLRVQRGITQVQLAADAGVDRAYVSELERADGNATLDFLDKLAAVLDVALDELVRAPESGAKRLKGLKSGRKPRAK